MAPDNAIKCYFFGIVHTLKDKLMVVKTIISPELMQSDPKEHERFNELVTYAQPNLVWGVQRIATLNNFNRNYLGIQSVVDLGPITNHILDASISEKG